MRIRNMTWTMGSKLGRRRLMIGGGVGALALVSSGCGLILYPNRRGRTSGQIDVLVLLIDLLWLLPGLIPGIVCLVVDFTTGCIYMHGERSERGPARHDADGRLAEASVEIDGEVVASGELEPDGSLRLKWKREVSREDVRARARLVVRAPGGAFAEARIVDLI
jgi:hypothetical protein